MIDRRALLLSAAAPLAASGFAFGQGGPWGRYANARYGFSIEHPLAFKPGPEPENGDGLAFKAADGAEFSVFGSLNVLGEGGGPLSVAQYEAFLKSAGDYSNTTYRVATADALVLSGRRHDRIFYERYLFTRRGELVSAFVISYPAARKAVYDPIVTRMAKSFRAGKPIGNSD